MSELPEPDHARHMRIVGHSNQGGRPDGVQVTVHRGFAYIGHMFSKEYEGWASDQLPRPRVGVRV